MYRTILLCYDGSPEGQNVLSEGTDIAHRFQLTAHLLAVIPDLFVGNEISSAELLSAERDEYTEVLEEGVAALQSAGLKVTGHLAYGRPAEVINAYAREIHADLIVLGHRPKSALARWWQGGSVDGELVNHAPCSILVAVNPQ